MQHKGIGESIGSSSANATKARPVNVRHNLSGPVANRFPGAVILIRPRFERLLVLRSIGMNMRLHIRYRWDIEDAMAKGAKGDGGVANVSSVREGDFEYANIGDDGR